MTQIKRINTDSKFSRKAAETQGIWSLVNSHWLSFIVCLLPIAFCLLRTEDCIVFSSSVWRLPFFVFRLSSFVSKSLVICGLKTAFCLLPIAYCILWIEYCLLLMAYCQLPTEDCGLHTASFFQPPTPNFRLPNSPNLSYEERDRTERKRLRLSRLKKIKNPLFVFFYTDGDTPRLSICGSGW